MVLMPRESLHTIHSLILAEDVAAPAASSSRRAVAAAAPERVVEKVVHVVDDDAVKEAKRKLKEVSWWIVCNKNFWFCFSIDFHSP